MFRSESPAPSITPSFTSNGPIAWNDIDPLAQSPLRNPQDSAILASPDRGRSHLEDARVRFDQNTTPSPQADKVIAGWSWPKPANSGDSPVSSGTEEDSALLKTKRTGTAMLSRVFGSPNAGDSQSPPYRRSASHGRSDSTDFLRPKRRAVTTTSTVPHIDTLAAATPPSSYLVSSPTTMSPATTRYRRPISLNLAPPPPTLNKLSPEDRSDLLRKNRKLQQMLGAEFTTGTPAATSQGVPRSSKSTDDSSAISGLVSSLGKKASRAFIDTSTIGEGRTRRIKSEASTPISASAFSGPGGLSFSTSAVLLTQGSTTDDVLQSGTTPTKLSKSKTGPSARKGSGGGHRPPHLGARKRSLSAANVLSPIPGTPESFMDFSSDIGEMSVNSPNPRPKQTRSSSAGATTKLPAGLSLATVTIDTSSLSILDDDRLGSTLATLRDNSRTPQPLNLTPTDPPTLPAKNPTEFQSPPTSSASSVGFYLTAPAGSGPHRIGLRRRSLSISSLSTVESQFTVDAEARERKRRRETLAKLHRYLDTSVPAGVVLGVKSTAEEGLPGCDPNGTGPIPDKWWKGAARSKSPGLDLNDDPRAILDSPMTEQDRALNVKRAAKMEKMFGANPPQGLYVLRSPVVDPGSSQGLDTTLNALEHSNPTTPGPGSSQFLQHNHSLNSLAYLVDKDDKESLGKLFTKLSKDEDDDDDMYEEIVFAPPEATIEDDDYDLLDTRPNRLSPRYEPLRRRSFPFALNRTSPTYSPPLASGSSFRASLPSPYYDKQRFSPNVQSPGLSTTFPSARPHLSPSPQHQTFKVMPMSASDSKRRSASSFTSFDVPAPDAFQLRRKRVAKLTKFFGTDYRSLFGQVLESLESGVREDRSRGSLTQEETDELLRKLQTLRVKQDQLSNPEQITAGLR